MIRRALVLLIMAASAAIFHAQQTGGGGAGAGGGGTATLPTATAAGQDLRATGPGTTYTAKNATNAVYLSCATEIGAQVNAAVTALGAGGGVIYLPNCNTATMTTTATNIPNNISIYGYGKTATLITCSVAGDCFQFFMNPNTQGETGSEIANFSVLGTNAASQVLFHAQGMSGYRIYQLGFGGPASGSQPVCVEFENTTTGSTFTERNYVEVAGNNCAPTVLLNQDAGDTNTSFGYNNFNISYAARGTQFGMVANGGGFLYNGSLQIFCNHVGPGGGCLQFNNGFSTDSALGIANEALFITAEENGTGAGVEVAATGTNNLNFYGYIVNGAYNASGTILATTTSVAGGATLYVSGPFGAQQNLPTAFTTASATDVNYATTSGSTPRAELCPNASTTCNFVVGHDVTTNGDQAALDFQYFGAGNAANRISLAMYGDNGLLIDPTGTAYLNQANALWTGFLDLYTGTGSTGGANSWIIGGAGTAQVINFKDVGTGNFPINILGSTGIITNGIGINVPANGGFQFSGDNTGVAAVDTGLWRPAANTVSVGTFANQASGTVQAADYVHTGTTFTISGCGATTLVGGATAGSFVSGTAGTCTVTITTGVTAPHGYACKVNDITTPIDQILQTAPVSTTQVTFSGTTASADVLAWGCMAY